MRQFFIKTTFIVCVLIGACGVNATDKSVSSRETLTIAVASNFLVTMQTLVDEYGVNGKSQISLSSGSSGKHVAQIKQGAPFDLFFSADSLRAQLLEDDGNEIIGSRFTYAVGRLALLSNVKVELEKPKLALSSPMLIHLAIANPRLAPYGLASQQVLESLDLWNDLQSKLVRGENINQAYQFIASGNAQLGFVSYAQIISSGVGLANEEQGSFWLIPQSHHRAIEQQAVMLKESSAARDFIKFIQSPVAKRIIEKSGYEVPDVN